MRLCASDPLCAEHMPGSSGLTLHGAACHACLFAAETSCERGNKYLDRGVLVDTVAGSAARFFELGEAGNPPAPAPEVLTPETIAPAEAPAGSGIAIHDLASLQGGAPKGWRSATGPPDEALFWMQMPSDALNRRLARGEWVLFRRVSESDPVPPDGSVVIVSDPSLKAEDTGNTVVRIMVDHALMSPDRTLEEHHLTLKGDSSSPVRRLKLVMSGAEWARWRPLATLVDTQRSQQAQQEA
jgi:hypothetical protein